MTQSNFLISVIILRVKRIALSWNETTNMWN